MKLHKTRKRESDVHSKTKISKILEHAPISEKNANEIGKRRATK